MDFNLNNKCTDFTKNGKCSNCGACCSNLLPLDDTDIRILKREVKKRHLKPITHHRIGEVAIDMICPFLDSNNKCVVYENRPKICRNFVCNKSVLKEKDIKYLGDELVPRNVTIAIWGDKNDKTSRKV